MSVPVAVCFRTLVATATGASAGASASVTGATSAAGAAGTIIPPSCEVSAYTQCMRSSGNTLTSLICKNISVSISTESLTNLGAALAGPGSELLAFLLAVIGWRFLSICQIY
jgi:hypothetical protein